VDGARFGRGLRGRSGEDVIRQSGGVGMRDLLIVQEISSSLGLVAFRLSPINLCSRTLSVPAVSYLYAGVF
jgi:hypothetical protein